MSIMVRSRLCSSPRYVPQMFSFRFSPLNSKPLNPESLNPEPSTLNLQTENPKTLPVVHASPVLHIPLIGLGKYKAHRGNSGFTELEGFFIPRALQKDSFYFSESPNPKPFTVESPRSRRQRVKSASRRCEQGRDLQHSAGDRGMRHRCSDIALYLSPEAPCEPRPIDPEPHLEHRPKTLSLTNLSSLNLQKPHTVHRLGASW